MHSRIIHVTPGSVYSQERPNGATDFRDQRVTPYNPSSASSPQGAASTAPRKIPQPDKANPVDMALKGQLPVLARLLLWLLGIVLFVQGLRGFGPKLKGVLSVRRVRRTLKRAGIATLHDAILPDMQSGLKQIDHLALMPWGIPVIETTYREGSIYGSTRDAQWTYRPK